MEKIMRNKTGKKIAFYIETLALLVVFTAVTAVLATGFLLAGKLSQKAAVLTKAVHLAENAAEMASASTSGEMLFRLLDEGNACVLTEAADVSRSTYRAKYDADMAPAADGIFSLDISWMPEEDGLTKSAIAVYWDDGTEPVYTLELALYTGGL